MIQLTRAYIHVNRFRQNLEAIKKKIGPHCRICVALKANAYGHGAVPLAHEAQKSGIVDYIGVATIPEGIELREAGIHLPIMKFSPCLPEEILVALQHDLEISVADTSLAVDIDRQAKLLGKTAKIQIKLDTGMGRIGFHSSRCVQEIQGIANLKNLQIAGIMTHFPVSDVKDKTFTLEQLEIFHSICEKLSESGLSIKLRHTANSGAILDLPETYLEMVRPGIMLYGYPPSGEVSGSVPIEPVMTLVTRISFIKRCYPGETISYGRTHQIERETCVATLPAGYADGYNRHLSGKGKVIIRDRFYPQIGRVCMDQIMVDIGPDPDFSTGEPVILMGKSRTLRFDAFEWAKIAGTISYEITCNINQRVARVFLYEETSDLS
ncbi:MAG: alanine racemase [Candidatus Wallbacteria bacterium]|nr:alanine racemase [Candidatus Wallbacteria bacterium]